MGVHVSPFGVNPKKGRVNKWRLILDLLSLSNHSVNDEISKENASESQVAVKIIKLGKGTLMGKMNVQQAYRNILVAPEVWRLLGMKWQGKV